MGTNLRLCLIAGLTPFLLVMVLGIRDLAGALSLQSNLDEAAFQGLEWAKGHGYDPDGITKAAQSATGLSGSVVAANNPCACSTEAAVALARCDTICARGGQPERYLVVTALICYAPTLAWPGVSYCSANNSQCAAAGCTPGQIVLSSQSLALQ